MTQDKVFSLIKEFTGQKNSIVINVTLIDFTGSIETALLLSQLIYWSDKTTIPGGWIAKTYDDWEEEIRLNEYLLRRSSKVLKELGFLETDLRKFNGSPTVHYRINPSKFSESFLEFLKNRNLKNSRIESKEIKGTSFTDTTTNTNNINFANPGGSLFPQSENEMSFEPGEKKEKGSAQKERKGDPLFVPLKEIYLNWYKEKEETDYYFAAKDAGALSQLIKKLKFAVKAKDGNNEPDEEQLKEAFKYVLNHLPKWFLENDSSLTIINSKFNQIIKQIKGKNYESTPGITNEQLAWIS